MAETSQRESKIVFFLTFFLIFIIDFNLKLYVSTSESIYIRVCIIFLGVYFCICFLIRRKADMFFFKCVHDTYYWYLFVAKPFTIQFMNKLSFGWKLLVLTYFFDLFFLTYFFEFFFNGKELLKTTNNMFLFEKEVIKHW